MSDACDRLGVDAVRTGVLRPLWHRCPPLAGPVATVRLEDGGGAPLPDLLETLAQAAGRLILVDLGGRLDVQCWGTVLATAARHFGVLGALVNGAARDVDGLQELGFPTYGRGVHPAAISGRLGVAAVDHPASLDGVVIWPGSFAVVDGSGAVFVPERDGESVLALAAVLRTNEEAKLQAVRDGGDPRAIFASEASPSTR